MYRANPEGINVRAAIFYWLLTLGYMGVIFLLSSYQGGQLPSLPENFDKVVHTGVYVPLAFLFYLSLRKTGIRKYIFVTAFLFASLYGITDEIHQIFVPGRDAAIGDALADFTGALIGCLGASFWRYSSGDL